MPPFLREPLIQFLLVGAILFGTYYFFQPAGSTTTPPRLAQGTAGPAASNPAPSRQIVLTLDQLTRLATVFEAQWGREPTPHELDLLVEADVKEEILYREGLALGLDRDDEIVRRRMAQKMQFLAEDVAAAHTPSDAELSSGVAARAPADFPAPSSKFDPPRGQGFFFRGGIDGVPAIASQQPNGRAALARTGSSRGGQRPATLIPQKLPKG